MIRGRVSNVENSEKDVGCLFFRYKIKKTPDVFFGVFNIRDPSPPQDRLPSPLRLDVWLDVACLCKTRSEAQKACIGGKVEVNGQSAKPQKLVRLGDVVEISRPRGVRQRVIVRGLETQHVAKAVARTLYEDTTPPPTPEVQAMLDLVRLATPRRPSGPQPAPDKREKRRLRRAKQGDDDPGWG